jgi:Na+/melibiose symporter-like transporter
MAAGLALLLALQVLGWSGYAPPPDGVTSYPPEPGALAAIRALTGPVGVALLGAAMVAAWLYPLTRERQREVRRELDARRAQRGSAP